MTWQKDHPRRRGELEFHFANETKGPDAKHLERAMERHERRHPMQP